jgi:hypothetical protein
LEETLGAYFTGRQTPGVLIVDGFDAARDPVVRQRVLRLIQRLIVGAQERWNVLVTVRVYDATKSPDLLSLFPPYTGYTGRGVSARHIEVPRLELSELEQVLDQVPGLSELYERATFGLRALLRLPFHLWLIEQVLRSSSSGREEALGSLSQVETEVQLLDRFWRARITGGHSGGSLATLAHRAAEVMVREQALTVPVPAVWTQAIQTAWEELLSGEILSLSGPAQSRVGYGHNILFDYATSLYVLSEDPTSMEQFLVQDPSRALFLRPSLVYLFAHLWQENRPSFWRLFRALARLEELPIRLVARLIPPVVLASEARTVEELVPLHELGWHDRDQVLLWVLQAVRFSPDSRLEVWGEFVSGLAIAPSPVYAWEAAGLLSTLLARAEVRAERDDDGKQVQARVRSHVGVAGRLMLAKALSERGHAPEGRNQWWDVLGANQALPLVLDTMGTDPGLSTEVIRSVLNLIKEPELPIRYFIALSRGVETIIHHDPALAADVYRSIFGHVELSEAATSMGGVVLRLQSTRRQDFDMAQYGLVKVYPEFLKAAPREAIQAGVECGVLDVLRDRILRHLKSDDIEAFLQARTRSTRFRGYEVQWIEDHSSIWRNTRRENGPQLIRAAADYIGRLAETGDERLSEVLDDYASHAQVGFAWARLLKVGARAAHILAEPLRELALERSIQLSADLREVLGEFLRAAAPHWQREGRAEVERSILSLVADDATGLTKERRERLSDQLLAALPQETLETPEAERRIGQLQAVGSVPTIEPLVKFHSESRPFTHDEWLREQGVNPERSENRELTEQVRPLETFRDTWQNEAPPKEAVVQIEVALSHALTALEQAAAADALVRRHAWTMIAGVAETIARSPSVVEDEERWERTRELLLRAWAEPEDEVGADADAAFTWPAWSPSPQTEAVQGLGAMLWKRMNPQIVSKFEEIIFTARDPSLRYLASRYALGLHRHDPDRYWDVAHKVATRDANVVVVTELLRGLSRLVWTSPLPVRRVVVALWPRWRATEHKDLLEALAPVLLVLAAHASDEWAETVLEELRQDPLSHENLLGQIHFEAAAALTPEVASGPREPHIARFVEILVQGIAALGRADEALRERQAQGGALADERGRIHQMVESVAARVDLNLRYDSTLRGENEPGEMAEARIQYSPLVSSYYHLVWPIVEAVLTFGERSQMLIASAAHHLLELFNVLLKADPPTVLKAANRAVQAGRGDNYNLDSMAIREVVRLMETVLVDHRDILIGGEPMKAGLQLLDTFAESGWTEALNLIWRLDEVFR